MKSAFFLAKGCFMEQNSREKTPPNIQFYFQSIITQPIYTFLKLGNGIGTISILECSPKSKIVHQNVNKTNECKQ